ncbi:winged helix-turn-helix domain-containing protein [Catenulispora sp. NF23]|uniref:AfsR/SARP family transcriptional regulator n=1 Tax=Catenulispora pinistramenti TaxID=2705254 RepID=UPI001BAD5F4D|nr:BTAD domain-containing putative transcriptional regulator [Catenulispora pinistramenti]MBS2535871.1 winged helix-turn-helix domain-containing protein [Catenulispora pinistramenti]
MRFAILGPTTVDDGVGVTELPSGIPEAVLVALLLSSPRMVQLDALVDAVWADRPPAAAVDSLRNHLSRLRRFLGPVTAERLTTRPSGYLIDLDGASFDVAEFVALSRRGRRSAAEGAWAEASASLTAAQVLWRGEPLAGRSVGLDLTSRLHGLREERLLVQTVRIEADLYLGRHQELVGELSDLTATQPLHEPAWRQLSLALYRAGRQADALDALLRSRNLLDEQLGLDPSPELRELYQRILNQDPALDADFGQGSAGIATPVSGPADLVPSPADPVSGSADPASQPAAKDEPQPMAEAGTGAVGVAQLPALISDFTGRDEQIGFLSDAIAARSGRAGQVPVAVITGGGGLGKTTLAVAAAHHVSGLFPDGSLFVDLHGMDATTKDPAEVLGQWLVDLGTPAGSVPVDADARQARFRSLTHAKRLLVVVDNARNAAQVLPLLPAASGSAVLVTSRSRLAELPAAARLDLKPLSGTEALSMLEELVGAERLGAEPEATEDILRVCAGLPLALRIVGARLQVRSSWPVHTLATRLDDERRRLDELSIGDLAARASFEVGFRSLPPGPHPESAPAPATVFTLLGLVTGPDITVDAVAALAGIAIGDAEAALDVLMDAHLVDSASPGRYHLHDLLRDFARELATPTDGEAEDSERVSTRSAALTRLVNWYCHAASAAADQLATRTADWDLLTRVPVAAVVPSFADREAAWSWFGAESANLQAAVVCAEAYLPGSQAWVLASQLVLFASQSRRWAEMAATFTVALRCARRVADPLGLARILSVLGYALGHLERYDEALETARQGVEAAERVGDPKLLITACNCYGWLLLKAERPREAVTQQEKTVAALREINEPEQIAAGLADLAEALAACGEHQAAVGCLQEALLLARKAATPYIEASILNALGAAHDANGSGAEAVSLLTDAARLRGAIDDRAGQGESLLRLARVLAGLGRSPEAAAVWNQASALVDELGGEDLAELRADVEQTVMAATEQAD